MQWLACTPDPIEHLWSQLKGAVDHRVQANITVGALPQIVTQKWQAFPMHSEMMYPPHDLKGKQVQTSQWRMHTLL